MKKLLSIALVFACMSVVAFGQASVTRNGNVVQQSGLIFTTPKVLEAGGGSDVGNIVIPAISGNQTYTFPAVTTTLVGATAPLAAGNVVIGGDGATGTISSNISVSGGNNISNIGSLNATTVNATNVALATPATNGQILIGSTATGNLSANVVTAGAGIGITNGATSITINATNVPNASLANSTITIGGTSTALGGTATTKPVFDNVAITTSTLTYSTTPAVDFAGDGFKIITLTGDATFSGSNYSAGKSVTVVIVGDSSTRNLAFDSDWIFIGAAAPSTLAANKKAVLTLTSSTGADTGVIAAYAAQP